MGSQDSMSIIGSLKIVNKYEGANAAMCCCVFPVSKKMAVGWSDGTVDLRDSATFELERTFASPSPNGLAATSLSANESDPSSARLLASYASGHTILWDIQKGTQIFSVQDDRQTLVNTFTPDFESFATSGSDAKINLHDAKDGSLKILLEGTLDPEVMDCHKDRVFALRFHPTRENVLLSGGWDDTVQFWDIRYPYSKKKILGPHVCGNDGIEFVDEDTFITASWRKRNTLEVWDYESLDLKYTIVPDDLNCFLYCCTNMLPDNILLVGGSHQNILRFVDFAAKKTVASITGLKGAVYFAKELPSTETSFIKYMCFCSDNTIYRAEIDI